MDIKLQNRINDVIVYLRSMMAESVDYQLMDPIAKMMLVALLYETQKIHDTIDNLDQKLTERFCEDFIPRQQVEAMPALAIACPQFKKNKDSDCVQMEAGVSFTYKIKSNKTTINYLPLFKNTLIPYEDIYVLTQNRLVCQKQTYEVQMDLPNTLWIGIETKAEIESLNGLSIFLGKKDNVYPQTMTIMGNTEEPLAFSTMNRMEDIEMLEPFDAQQMSSKLLSIMEYWKGILQELPNGVLITITDKTNNRDLFKKRAYPHIFQNWLESDVLNCFSKDTLWFKIDFPGNYIVSEDYTIIVNAIPIVNIDVNTATLTQSSPVAKLQKEDSFFVTTLETSNTAHKQGFAMSAEEFVIRDFDAHCYHHGDLYRDIRNLYNHFIEDYHAFTEYHGLKDGQDIKRLKELVNKIAKSAGEKNDKFKFDSGTYIMKNVKQAETSSVTKVSFLTTQGALGNILDVNTNSDSSSKLECKKMPVIESNVPIVVSALGGKDKATADQRYELIRYYTLTNDRLYTKMDVEAFVRKELVAVYGKEEFKRIFVNIHVEGTAGQEILQRGLYVDIDFKDEKNYNLAIDSCLVPKLQSAIELHACISMPIVISLYYSE